MDLPYSWTTYNIYFIFIHTRIAHECCNLEYSEKKKTQSRAYIHQTESGEWKAEKKYNRHSDKTAMVASQ